MSAKRFLSGDILPLIELEISMIERYFKEQGEQNLEPVKGKSPAISLIYFSLPQGDGYGEIFEKILRQTDVVFQENEHYIAVLYGTDKLGASVLLEGIQEFLNAKPIDLVLTFPDDASTAKSLITKFQDEIKDEYGVILETLKIEQVDVFEEMI